MLRGFVVLSAAAMLCALSSLAQANETGALTGGVGGAAVGAVVGGPVGAVVGGLGGAVIGNSMTNHRRPYYYYHPYRHYHRYYEGSGQGR
jgi:uncharacterized protein YcfJ